MVIVQFGLLMFSLSLLIAACLAPPEAWLTPLGAEEPWKYLPSDNDGEIFDR